MGKKFINPVEKARKQAKKKESNKQKKQRQEARSTNLKGKDPNLILSDLERLDKIQYNIEEPPKLNEKVIENKRKKLKETWYRILGVFKKEDEQRFTQLKKLEMEYEAKRVLLIKKYEAINSAKQVNLEEIPLPFCPDEDASTSENTTAQDITINLTKSNLREPQTEYLTLTGEIRTDLKPPGCPSSVPPSIEELEEAARQIKESKNAEKDLDEFLKEVDQVEKMASKEQSTNANTPVMPPPTLVNVPPMLAAGLPPKPCASLPNPVNPAPFPVLLTNPMGLLNHPHHLAKKPNMPIRPPPINNQHLASKFNVVRQPMRKETEKVSTFSTTIEAKPQLRNLSADVTKFLPTSLRIKRQETKKPIKPNEGFHSLGKQPMMSNQSKPVTDQQGNKDTAYEEFMRELNGLI